MADRHGELSGRVAIVTGGAAGIGAATCDALAERGAAVTVADVAEEINEVADRIKSSGGAAQAVTTDVSDQGQVEGMVQRTVDEFGRLDFLLNVAAVTGTTENVWLADPQAWAQAPSINLFGTFMPTRAALPHMLERGSGRVLNVTSGLGQNPTPQTSAYGSSKAGVTHFTRILATELLGTGVTANAVDPGVVGTALATDIVAGLGGGAGPPQWGPRPQDPWESARLLAWLCGPVGSWINGQVVDVNNPIVRGLLQLPVPVTFS